MFPLGSRSIVFLSAVALASSVAGCNGGTDSGGGGGGITPPPAPSNSLRFQPITAVLTSPVFMTAAPGDLARFFVVEQGGLIRILDSLSGAPRANPFLNVQNLISSGGERGLLGMAFDPNYGTNGRFYIF